MEHQYTKLADRALAKLERKRSSQKGTDPTSRLYIAVAGAPGSGKTTITTQVAQRIKFRATVTVLGMDGFHLPRSTLDQLPNRKEAYIRRGAPWTFDGAGAVDLIKRCRSQVENEIVYAPSFDHSVKDPIPNDVAIDTDTDILIFEGLYLLSSHPPWNEIGDLVDERWFVSVPIDVARERVARRHVEAGIEPDIESGRRRVDQNDTLNGIFINESSRDADVVIESISYSIE